MRRGPVIVCALFEGQDVGGELQQDGRSRSCMSPQGDSEGPNLHQLHSTAITRAHLGNPASSVRGTPTRTIFVPGRNGLRASQYAVR